ncbi:MAG TPA: hypothetical protein VK206_04920 [Anaerolineales bacterium]|nr:hypothetical protein [Anaerolineales bacterium]
MLKRHAEALHELTAEEFNELAQIQAKTIRLLYEELRGEKEYVSCYAEKEHFQHIHFHIFARPSNFPDELKGGGSFALLKVSPEEAVASNEIISFCGLLRDKFAYAP